MDKFEKIINIPACFITKETADKISRKISEIAFEKSLSDYKDALVHIANQLNLDSDELIKKHLTDENAEYLPQLVVRNDKVIFVSKQKNIECNGRNVSYEEIPMDIEAITANVDGVNGKRLNIFVNI